MDFYNEIAQSIAEECKDNGKYMKLSEIALTDKAKRILRDIAREEERHKEFLQEIMEQGKSHGEAVHVPAEDEPSE